METHSAVVLTWQPAGFGARLLALAKAREAAAARRHARSPWGIYQRAAGAGGRRLGSVTFARIQCCAQPRQLLAGARREEAFVGFVVPVG
jgi:hypothetical protein